MNEAMRKNRTKKSNEKMMKKDFFIKTKKELLLCKNEKIDLCKHEKSN